ncbi:unnamed protein product [Closterium sp. NIES-53]
MDGTIPPVLSTTLTSLDLQGNQFSGRIPHFLGYLSSLQSLVLTGNNFSGAIPQSFTNLVNVSSLCVSSSLSSRVVVS